jgi:hypothetical protein
VVPLNTDFKAKRLKSADLRKMSRSLSDLHAKKKDLESLALPRRAFLSFIIPQNRHFIWRPKKILAIFLRDKRWIKLLN